MELLKDMNRLGPAPTWERELAAAAANLVFLVLVVGVLVFAFDARIGALIVIVLGLGYLVGRLVVAARRRRAEASR